ncbi:MAG: polysaccharide pyruvyl transferase family protein [Candidatus Bathyarchaeia archaeon]
MRIAISGHYGWGNTGDEAILQSIMDALGYEKQYLIYTCLPSIYHKKYKELLGNIEDIRPIYDGRLDFDICIFTGDTLRHGLSFVLHALINNKPNILYGIGGYEFIANQKIKNIMIELIKAINEVTVRDEELYNHLLNLGAKATLVADPALTLHERPTYCPSDFIAVCPRYYDEQTNIIEAHKIIDRLRKTNDEILLIPFHPYDVEGNKRDILLCEEIAKHVANATILQTDGYHPREVKYVISKSKMVISGGRYHAILWAIAHNKPFEILTPTFDRKINSLVEMYKKYGAGTMISMAHKNIAILMEMVKRCMLK